MAGINKQPKKGMISPTKHQIKRAISRSGYVLELRLCPVLENHAYHVDSSAQFEDQDTGKSRELDVYGWKEITLKQRHIPERDGGIYISTDTLKVEVIVECKNNASPLIFFTRRVKYPDITDVIFDGFPSMIWEKDELRGLMGLPLDQEFHFKRFHSNWRVNYPAFKFGKLVAKKGSEEWIIEHGDLYESIEKLCKAAHSYRTKSKESASYKDEMETDPFHLFTIYPVLVLSGDFYECRVRGQNELLKKSKLLHLDWTVESNKIQESFRISVVTERHFSDYLDIIDHDLTHIVSNIRKNEERLRQAVVLERADEDHPRSTIAPR